MGRPLPAEEIHTARLLLRKHRLSDAPTMFQAIDQDRERLGAWLPWVDLTRSAEDSRRNLVTCLSSWESGDLFDYGFYSHSGEFVGRGGLHSLDWSVPKGEFGYWMTKRGEGHGFASEAVSALEEEFFRLGLERLEVRCDPLNVRSAALPRRLGYRLEAILHRESRRNGKLRDTMVWAKLKHDHRKSIPARPSFIGHWSEFLAADDARYPGSDELLAHGVRLGHQLGLTAIGIHIELLAPGRRTSWPHAESSEEEFAFVLEGTPDAWIDGVLHRLVPGDLVAFPAGTGIAHTFLNNTLHPCKLLVGGESSKKENKIYYPLHPARMAECRAEGWAWDDAPRKELGPHDGMTDELRKKTQP